MERGIFRTQAKRCGRVLVTGALVLGGLLSTQSMAQAKLLDILDVFNGGMEAGDTINAPIMASVTPTKESAKQALKYNNKVVTTFAATESMSSATEVKPLEVASYGTEAKKNTSNKNKTDDEDDPFASLIFLNSSGLSSIGRSGSHAFTFPSFSFFTTTPSAPDYTTDASYLQSELNNPEVTLSYMQQNFSYENHNGNTPYAPSELNSLRAGDCKDFATFFGWALADDAWEVHTIDYQYGSSSGHVISVYPGSDGKWYAQSNQYSVGPISSTEDAIAQTMPSGGTLGSYREFPAGYTGTYSWN